VQVLRELYKLAGVMVALILHALVAQAAHQFLVVEVQEAEEMVKQEIIMAAVEAVVVMQVLRLQLLVVVVLAV
jgi:hypothetical protein